MDKNNLSEGSMLKDYFKKLYTGSQQEFCELAANAMDQGQRMFIITANPETMMIGDSNEGMDQALCSPESTIVPDGIGVVKAAEQLGKTMHGRVTGVELSAYLINHVGTTGKSVYFYGAKQEVLDALIAKVKADYPEINIVGSHNGYGNCDDQVFEEIVSLQPDLVLVALGIPRQEILINKYLDKFSKGIFIGVGGSFDVLSGTKKRAPAIFCKLNLEWLYRIMKEPKRFSRFFRSNVRFISKIRKIKSL